MSFDVAALTFGAKVVVRALQIYGMTFADGGRDALNAKSDRFTYAKYGDLIGGLDLAKIKPGDFQVVDAVYGTDSESSFTVRHVGTHDCTRP